MNAATTPDSTAPVQENLTGSGRPRAVAVPLLICLLLAAITMGIYWPSRHFEFINYDDQDYVSENFHVQAGLNPDSLQWAFSSVHASNWHPLTWISHMLDCRMFGLKAGRHHLTSALIHALNSVLVFIVLKRLTGSNWRSAFVAALFAWHPLHVESVAWISERKDVLSTFFGLLTLLAYTSYTIRRTYGTYLLAVLFFALALMSKPMWVTLPFLLLLLDLWPLQRWKVPAGSLFFQNPAPLVREKIPFLILSAASCVATFAAQHHGGAVKSLESLPVSARLENALVSYARYLGKVFWPVDLALPYPYPGGWPLAEIILAAALITVLCFVAIGLIRKRPFVFTGWFWFVGMLVPVIGLVQVGAQAMADRYTYAPSIGLFIVVAWAAGELANNRSSLKILFGVVGCALLVACTLRTRDQLSYWRNSGTLAAHAIAVTKDNDIAYSNLGNYRLENGQLDEAIDDYKHALRTMWSGGEVPADPVAALTGAGSAHEQEFLLKADPRKLLACVEILNNLGTALARKDQIDEGIALYRLALQINPNHALALHNLAFELATRKDYATALEFYQKAVQLKPDQPHLHVSYGNALAEAGRVDEAIGQYEIARTLAPEDPQAHYHFGLALITQGRNEEAIAHFEAALRADPSMIEVHNQLGSALMKTGRVDEAIQHFRLLLQKEPAHARAHDNLGVALAAKGQLEEATTQLKESLRYDAANPNTHFNLGNVLAMQRKLDEAVAEYGEAVRLAPDLAKAHCHMGAALAELGRRDEAIQHLKQALHLAPDYELAKQQLRLLGQEVK